MIFLLCRATFFMSFDAFGSVACRRRVYSCREIIKKRGVVSFFCPTLYCIDIDKFIVLCISFNTFYSISPKLTCFSFCKTPNLFHASPSPCSLQYITRTTSTNAHLAVRVISSSQVPHTASFDTGKRSSSRVDHNIDFGVPSGVHSQLVKFFIITICF